MRVAGLDFPAASGASETVVVRIRVAYAYLGLQIPPPVKHPRITVCKAGTNKPTLIACVGQSREVGAQQIDAVVNTAYIELSAVGVNTDEMSAETVAEPIAQLRLHGPMLPGAVVRQLPSVKLPRGSDGPFGCKTHVRSNVHIEQGIGKKITLYCDSLSPSHRNESCDGDK